MLIEKRILKGGGVALLVAFALAVSAIVPNLAYAEGDYPFVLNDQCGTENDTIEFPATFNGANVISISSGAHSWDPGTISIDDQMRDRINNGFNFEVQLDDYSQPQEFSIPGPLNDEPCPTPQPDPQPPSEVPAEVGGCAVESMRVENANGTSAVLTPGMPIESGSTILETVYSPADCVPKEAEDPEEPVAPDDPPVEGTPLVVVPDDQCGTENDTFTVIGDSVGGVQAKHIEFSGHHSFGDTIPFDQGIYNIAGGIPVVLQNGNRALLQLPEGFAFTNEPCPVDKTVEPNDPTVDNKADAEESSKEKKEDPKNAKVELAQTGVKTGALGALALLITVVGAGGIVARRRV